MPNLVPTVAAVNAAVRNVAQQAISATSAWAAGVVSMGPSLGGPSALPALARQAQSEPKPSVPTAAPAVPKTELAAAPLAAAAPRPVDPVALAAQPAAFGGQA